MANNTTIADNVTLVNFRQCNGWPMIQRVYLMDDDRLSQMADDAKLANGQ